MKKYDMSSIMSAAWKMFHKGVQSFATALRMAWANAKAHNAAKAEAGISEETHTWAGWRDLGYEVAHGSTALYKAILSDPAIKSQYEKGGYKVFSVQPIKPKRVVELDLCQIWNEAEQPISEEAPDTNMTEEDAAE